jgi:hypothetical protein
MKAIWTRLANPLRSRKVRVAIAGVVAAYAAEYGLGVSEELVLTILGVTASIILGIAHEDAGAKSKELADAKATAHAASTTTAYIEARDANNG